MCITTNLNVQREGNKTGLPSEALLSHAGEEDECIICGKQETSSVHAACKQLMSSANIEKCTPMAILDHPRF